MEGPDPLIVQGLEKGDFQPSTSCRRINPETPDVHIVRDPEEEKGDFSTAMSSHGEKRHPISVERYADYSSSSSKTQQVINLTDEEPIVQFRKNCRKIKTEAGQYSNSKKNSVFCPICVEPKSQDECFTLKICSHIFCSDCIRGYVAAEIQENNTAQVNCPNKTCNAELEPWFCESILPKDVFERWGNMLCESMILGSVTYYCPFEDCSAVLLDEKEDDVIIKESECPYCRRLFCAQCKVPWHSGIGCEEFQKLGKDGREQSSNSQRKPVFCPICMETKLPNECFAPKNCSHIFCSDCMSQYVASKIQENIAKISCPDTNCNAELEPVFCESILPKDVFERWGNVLCESLIAVAMKFYCPFKDCSALLLDEPGEGGIIKEAECPHCRRLFCASCKVPWHSEMGCEEFQKLGKNEREREDILLMDLAKKSKWKRCPKCKIYVERIDGCLWMRCRCGFHFCYHCGAKLDQQHYCPQCKRTWD